MGGRRFGTWAGVHGRHETVAGCIKAQMRRFAHRVGPPVRSPHLASAKKV